jgi:hypothetical protein
MWYSAILLLLVAAAMSFGQTVAPTATMTVGPAVPVASPASTSLSSSDEFLRGQLTSLNSLHDSLISTVHWALSIAFGVAVLLVTYNWLVTGRNIARDKEALRQELKGMFETAEAQSHERLVQQLEKHKSAIASSLEKSTATALVGLEQPIKRQQREMDSLRKDITSELNSIRCDLLVTEARYWNSQKIAGNEFSSYLRLLELASASRAPHVNTALEEILRLLQDPATSYFTSEVAELTAILDKLPPPYAAIVGAVKEALAKKIVDKPPI